MLAPAALRAQIVAACKKANAPPEYTPRRRKVCPKKTVYHVARFTSVQSCTINTDYWSDCDTGLEELNLAETKTKATGSDVDAFVDAVPDETRRADARTLLAMMRDITGEPATMWGPTMIGFGRYHYRYDSGHEGDAFLMGFSPRKAEQVLYVLTGDDRQRELLARLGKHREGKSCLYVKTLAGVDGEVLETILRECWAQMKARHA